MGRLPNPFVYDLHEIAEGLALRKGRPNLRQAAPRRLAIERLLPRRSG